MFFLLRMTFWLGLVLVLLPTDKAPDDKNVPQIGAAQAVTAAGAAVSDLSQFCTRNPNACETGKAALNNAGVRASEVAKVGYQYLDTQLGAKTNGADAAVAAAHGDTADAATATDKSDLIKAKLREMAMREILEAAVRQREQANAVDGKTTGTIAKK